MPKQASREPRDCPCGSAWPYETCCAPLHRGEREAGSPDVLMRSRFAAFAVGAVDYLWKTLHADHDDRERPRADVIADLSRACRTHRYERLRVIDSRHDESSGQVLFHARVIVGKDDRSFVELSDFLRDGTGWRYLCGITRPGKPGDLLTRARSIDDFTALLREA